MSGDPVETTRALVEERYPDCSVAILAGSVVRGGATATSDLDLVLVVDREEAPFRESLTFRGWPVEAFVHTSGSWRDFFQTDAERGRPSLPTMCVEGIVLRDRDGLGAAMVQEARDLIERGPAPLTEREIAHRRYSVTDLLDDFLGCEDPAEGIFIAANLATAAAALLLLGNGRWIGDGKWVMRALQRYHPGQALDLSVAMFAYTRGGAKEPLVHFVDRVLEPFGGRLFEGYFDAAPKQIGETSDN